MNPEAPHCVPNPEHCALNLEALCAETGGSHCALTPEALCADPEAPQLELEGSGCAESGESATR
eukprot:7598746-Alexandrium_andersonii.AAC.1